MSVPTASSEQLHILYVLLFKALKNVYDIFVKKNLLATLDKSQLDLQPESLGPTNTIRFKKMDDTGQIHGS